MKRLSPFRIVGLWLGALVSAAPFACTNTEAPSTFPPSAPAPTPPLSAMPGSFGIGDGGGGASLDGAAMTACGNGIKNADSELCDDGNRASGDGCNDRCRIEPGWTCPTAGRPCVAIRCGDGVLAGDEDCDDANAQDGDGCSAKCRVEDGFKCPTQATPCVRTTCGDGLKEGVEQCDDKNQDPFDGCDPSCKVEPVCANGTCSSVCGDGLKFPGEACDDGNRRSGDGCSSTCTLEPGFSCTHTQASPPPFKDLWVAYRDFKSAGATGGHPDFFAANFTNPAINTVATGLVKALLDGQGRPEFLSRRGTGNLDIVQDATSFGSWFRDTAFSKKVVSTLRLTRQPDNTYSYDNADFFPLDLASAAWPERHADAAGAPRNFLFTSELRIPFTYRGGENLTFRGDDDVWVYVNGHLAVDLGGVKSARDGSVTLGPQNQTQFGLVPGGFYEFAVFQAERNPVASSYRLTLNDFDRVLSQCTSVCGDGVKSPDELCDDGAANNTGAYGKCTPECGRGPFCGDGIRQAEEGEECDSLFGCTADCRLLSNAPR